MIKGTYSTYLSATYMDPNSLQIINLGSMPRSEFSPINAIYIKTK
jgi:hypothetical protein